MLGKSQQFHTNRIRSTTISPDCSFEVTAHHHHSTMARRKQAAPLQRAASSEIIERPLEKNTSPEHMNGHSKEINNLREETTTADAPEQAGLAQLIICIGGIYASLYPPNSSTLPSPHPLTQSPVYHGPSSKNA